MMESKIREALRRQGITKDALTDAQRERAERVTTEQPDLKGKDAVTWIMTDPAAATSNGRGPRDPEAQSLADRAQTLAKTKSRFWSNEARRFIDEFTVETAEDGVVTVTRGRPARGAITETFIKDDLVAFADGSLSRPNRKPVATAIASLGDGSFHWDRALAAMIAVQVTG
jgi:hypothetical protein